jgi:hypothetical protein
MTETGRDISLLIVGDQSLRGRKSGMWKVGFDDIVDQQVVVVTPHLRHAPDLAEAANGAWKEGCSLLRKCRLAIPVLTKGAEVMKHRGCGNGDPFGTPRGTVGPHSGYRPVPA